MFFARRGPNILNNHKKCLIWLIFTSILISACGEAAAAPATRFEPCTPDKNSYADPIDSNLVRSYETGIASIGNPSEFDRIRQEVFRELVNRVYDWTDSIVIDTGQRKIEITITYIRPELVHLIVINHYLFIRNNNFTGRLDEQVKSQLSRIMARNEHIFFIVFIASQSNNHMTVNFPLSELELTNTSNLTVRREHDDHNLEKPIFLQSELEYGFFYFPMAVINNGICQTVIDKARDTSILISAPSITIDGTNYGQQSWKYKYSPLIDMTSVSPISNNKFQVVQPVDQISPIMGTLSPDNKEDQIFWIALARIIWLETLDP